MQEGTFRLIYNAETLKSLNYPSTIHSSLYCNLKNLEILKNFRGCRSGKAVKDKLKVKRRSIPAHYQSCELKRYASKNSRKRNASNLKNDSQPILKEIKENMKHSVLKWQI